MDSDNVPIIPPSPPRPIPLNYAAPTPRARHPVLGWTIVGLMLLPVALIVITFIGAGGVGFLLFLTLPVWAVFGAMIRAGRYRPEGDASDASSRQSAAPTPTRR